MSGGIPPLPEAEAVAQRAKLRETLKAEFRKQITHPFRGEGPMFDPAFQRFMAMKASQADFFKVTPKTTKYGLIPLIATYVGVYLWFDTAKKAEEDKLRSGQVAYRDRLFKFN